MRHQHMKVTRHAGVMCASCLVFLVVAGAGVFTGLSPQATAGAAPPDGALLFRTYCASCHGTTATGGGAAAIAMKVTPPDLTGIAARNNGVFPSERVTQIVLGRGVAAHGERNMPVWGDIFARKPSNGDPKAMIDALVRYLGNLQRRPA